MKTEFPETHRSSEAEDISSEPGYPARLATITDFLTPESAAGYYGMPQSLVDTVYPECSENESLVHTSETKKSLPEFSTYRAHRSQNCVDELAAVREVYEQLDGQNPNGKQHQLDRCRTNAWFARNKESGEVKVFSSACHLRWCPMCAEAKQAYVTKSTSEWLKDVGYPKLLTLTILHTDLPLEEQINNLYDYFKRLRKRKAFSSKVTGGFWFFQIKISKTDGLWHPHLHCLVSGLLIAHSTIKRLWKEISYTSEIVDIRSITDKDNAARHVARYAARPSELINLSVDHRLELVEAMHGRRLVGTWGDARGVSLKPPKCDDKSEWESVGSWSIIRELLNTDESARKIFNAWKNATPLEADISCRYIEKFIDEEYADYTGPGPPAEYTSTFFENN